MNYEQKRVAEFHRKHGLPAPAEPTVLTEDEKLLRYSLILEELEELSYAMGRDDFIDQIDAVADLLYLVYGTAVAMGVDIEPFFQEVHRSNMTKAPGKKRPDGKVLKCDDYEEPDLVSIFCDLYTYSGVAIGAQDWDVSGPVAI